jgi:hypothetical protein
LRERGRRKYSEPQDEQKHQPHRYLPVGARKRFPSLELAYSFEEIHVGQGAPVHQVRPLAV